MEGLKKRELLNKLSKRELDEVFVSLSLDRRDKKESLIDSIVASNPTSGEVEAFTKLIAEKEAEADEISDQKIKDILSDPKLAAALKKALSLDDPEPEPFENVAVPVYIVVHQINESGHLFKIGSYYTGRFAARFLKGGQIRARE